MSDTFRHVDAARIIAFGPEAVSASTDLIGEGHTLLREVVATRPLCRAPR
jgi:hypothetical protein